MKKTHLITGILCASLGLATSALAAPFGYSVRENDQVLVRIDLANGSITDIGPTGGDDIDGLAFAPDGTLYGSDNDDDELVTIDPVTGAQLTQTAYSRSITNSGLSINRWGTIFLAEDSDLHTVDTSANISLIGAIGGSIDGIAFNRQGVLYGINDSNNSLVTLDPDTGAISRTVGALGISTSDQQGLSFDGMGNLYMVNESSESLYSVNTNTGAATLIADLGNDYENLAIEFEDIEPQPVPTMSAYGLLLLSGLLGLLGFLRRRAS